jgi:hypothetical protein
MHSRRHVPRRGDVDHGVQGRQQQHVGRLRTGSARGVHRLLPDVLLQGRGTELFCLRSLNIRQFLIRRQPRIQVLAKQLPQRRLRLRRQQIDSQPRRSDIVGFFGDQLPPIIEARRGTGKRKRDQQPEQCKYGALDRARAGARAFGVGKQPAHGESAARLDGQQHSQEQENTKERHNREKVRHAAIHAISPGLEFLLVRRWIGAGPSSLALASIKPPRDINPSGRDRSP